MTSINKEERRCEGPAEKGGTNEGNMCTSPALSSRPAPHLTVSQVAALEPDGSLFFSSVTGGAGVWSWSSVIVVGAGFTTTVPRRVTWAGESSRHIEVLVQGHCRNGGEVQPSRLLLSIAPNTRLLPSPPGLGADAGTAGLPSVPPILPLSHRPGRSRRDR